MDGLDHVSFVDSLMLRFKQLLINLSCSEQDSVMDLCRLDFQ